MQTIPETAPEVASIAPKLEAEVFAKGAVPYASLYASLAEQLARLDPGTAFHSLDALSFQTPGFRKFIHSLRLSCDVHGLAGEADYQRAKLRESEYRRRLPFPPSFIRFDSEPPDDELTWDNDDDAYAYLATKVPVNRDQFNALSGQESLNALTVAHLAEQAIRSIVKPALLRVLAGELTYEGFLEQVKDLQFGVPGRLSPELHKEIVYRTNVMTAYNFGRIEYGLDPSLADFLPGGQLMVVLDERTSDICRPLYGRYVSREDIVNGRFAPPFHYSCRTTFVWVNRRDWDRLQANRILPANYWTQAPDEARILDNFGYFKSVLWERNA